MPKTVRHATAAMVATGVLIVTGPVYAHEELIAATERQPSMVLHVMNYASLSRSELDVAKARVAMIYQSIGVRIVWVDSEGTVVQREAGRRHFTVLLLSREMSERKISADHIKEGVLAQAHVTGSRASIFCARIAAARGAANHFPSVLAKVIAHEVGHLILGPNSHSPSGIMRAHMDLQVSHLLSFEQRQAAAIRTSLMELTPGNAAR